MRGVLGREEQRGVAVDVAGFEVGEVGQQQTERRYVVVGGDPRERGVAGAIARRGVRAREQ